MFRVVMNIVTLGIFEGVRAGIKSHQNKQLIKHTMQLFKEEIKLPTSTLEEKNAAKFIKNKLRKFIDNNLHKSAKQIINELKPSIQTYALESRKETAMGLFEEKIGSQFSSPQQQFEAKLLRTHFTKFLNNNLYKSADEIIPLFKDKMNQYKALKRSSNNIVIKNVLRTTLAKTTKDAKKNNEPIPTKLPEKNNS